VLLHNWFSGVFESSGRLPCGINRLVRPILCATQGTSGADDLPASCHAIQHRATLTQLLPTESERGSVSTDTVRIDPPIARKSSSRRTRSSAIGAEAIQFPLIVWVVHWLLSQIPATLAYHYGSSRLEGPSWAYQIKLEALSGPAHWLVEPMRLWDGSWYRLVANSGYDPNVLGLSGLSAKAAFFPLYPWLMRWGHQLTGWSPETIGYIISNLAFFGALILLYRLVTMDFNEVIAKRTMWALALFPTAFFFSAVYTESLFLLFAVGTLYAARRGEWLLAGIVGLLAALTRSAGVMLLAPMAVLFIQQYGWNPRRWFPNAFAAAIPAAGPLIFGWILTSSNMKFFDWVNQQWQWNRFSATPWKTFDCTLNGCVAQNVRFVSGQIGPADVRKIQWDWISDILRHPTWEHFTSFAWRDWMAQGDVLEFVITVLAFALIVIGLWKLPLYYSAFTIPPMLVPLFSPSSVHPLMSMPRFVLPLFPIFVMIALLVTNRKAGIALAIASSIGLILLTMQFALWYWVA